jgi:signal transduction histidine kinase
MDGRTRARFFRRVALGAIVAFALLVSGVMALAWIVAEQFGFSGSAGPVVLLVILFSVALVLRMTFGAMRRFASPLGEVMDAADLVADGDYTVRVREHGPPPMRALAHSFNTMTERLQHADRVRRDLMADVAHELRTPVTVLQGRLEGLLDGVYPRDDRQITEALDETHVLSRLIEDLRTLALTDAGALPLQKESTDLAGLVNEVARSLHAEAGRKGVALNVTTAADDVTMELDPLRIREVLTNLVSNALRHTPPGGAIGIALSGTDGVAAVRVSDTGEGMSAEAVDRMFDRFYKGSTSRGSGLGLTIAKGIVTAHGGEITASSEPGKGTVVTFTLPRSLG